MDEKERDCSIFKNWMGKGHGLACILGVGLLIGGKYFYKEASCDQLLWILTPTTCLVQWLSGISFAYIPQVGYVNHVYQFIIAASCSGVQFMMIASAMLFFSFLPQIKTWGRGFLWLGVTVAVSYIYTVLVNSGRILASVFLPVYLRKRGFFNIPGMWITPKKLHSIIGIFIYFSSLLILYAAVETFFRQREWKDIKLTSRVERLPCQQKPLYWPIPVFWYFVVVLGIPFLNQAIKRDFQAFTGFACLIILVCLPVLLLFILAGQILRRK
ncbi:MAG: exosortase K [Lachnospiraceae bacterium]|jgi:exosortase K|nr:exosortase K [Lachnospiraceae bacterium]